MVGRKGEKTLVPRLLTRFIRRLRRSSWSKSLHTCPQGVLLLAGEMTTGGMIETIGMMTEEEVRREVQEEVRLFYLYIMSLFWEA